MTFKDQVVLVTGGSRGIGAATAKLFARHGARVAVNYVSNPAAAEKVVADIGGSGGKAMAVQADVRRYDEVAAMVETVTAQFGPIDILVLNAGARVPYKSFMDLTYVEFESKVMGELQGFFNPVKIIVPSMMTRKKGCIIGISSGLSRRPGPNFSAHTTAKSAVDGMMMSLALELGPFGIRVNTVAPGLTLTDATSWMPKEQVAAIARMTPLQRVGLPEDIAGVILAVASPEAGFVTGAYIPVNGGQQMS
jgi:3-oxoacyl-[acyl-carrier protein] reductase